MKEEVVWLAAIEEVRLAWNRFLEGHHLRVENRWEEA